MELDESYLKLIIQNCEAIKNMNKSIDVIQEELKNNRDLLSSVKEIASLKADLSNTDYKITKCIEYQLAELELPYDVQELHTTRQTLRDRINELESEMS